MRALVMADTVGTLAHPESDRLIAENAAAHPRSAQYGRGAHPACGERMFREQPALHFLYTEVSGLTDPPPAADFRERLAALRTRPVDDVAKLPMPVLCIAGEEDMVIPPGAVRGAGLADSGARATSRCRRPGTRCTGSGPRRSIGWWTGSWRRSTAAELGTFQEACSWICGSAVILTAPVSLPNGGGQDDRAPSRRDHPGDTLARRMVLR